MMQQKRTRYPALILFMIGACITLSNIGCRSVSYSARFESKPTSSEEMRAMESESVNDDSKYNLNTYNSDLENLVLPPNAKDILSGEMQKLIGVPYKYGGLDSRGIDCSGFVFRVFINSYKVKLPHSSLAQSKLGKPVSKANLDFGDLVFFRISRNRISHVGIYVGEGKFIHASLKRGVMVSRLDEKYYLQYYATARRLINFNRAL